MYKLITIFTISILLNCSLLAQRINLDTLGVLPRDLKEISGIQKTENGHLWTHNDSGNKTYVYKINSDGQILKSVFIKNVKNIDWEAIAADNMGYIYIADIGNNRNDRQNLAIYKISEADLLKKDTATAEVISFTYSGQVAFPPDNSRMNYDAEALVFVHGSLFIFTKNRTNPFSGYSIIHEIPPVAGTYQTRIVDSILIGEGAREMNQITGADISPDGKRMVLMSYDKMIILHEFPYRDFAGGRIEKVEFANLSQKESVAFLNDSVILIADEKSVLGGGNIYSYNLSPHIKTNSEIRRNEVNIPVKAFGDTLLVELNTEVRGKVYYEFFNNDGIRVDAGSVGYFDRGAATFQLTPPPFLNGTYMLNIQVGKRPHAFFVHRFTGVDWEKVRKEFEKGQN